MSLETGRTGPCLVLHFGTRCSGPPSSSAQPGEQDTTRIMGSARLESPPPSKPCCPYLRPWTSLAVQWAPLDPGADQEELSVGSERTERACGWGVYRFMGQASGRAAGRRGEEAGVVSRSWEEKENCRSAAGSPLWGTPRSLRVVNSNMTFRVLWSTTCQGRRRKHI